MTAGQIRRARDLVTLPGNNISSIARLPGVSRSTIYKYLPELAAGHRSAAGQIPLPRPGLPARLAITAPPAARCHDPRHSAELISCRIFTRGTAGRPRS